MTSLDPVWTIGSQMTAVIRARQKVRRSRARELAVEWLLRVGLGSEPERILSARPYELSGGMRQRAMLAIALCAQPKLLIADEPTSALDASLSREMMELLSELTTGPGTTLIIISHDILLCLDYADRVVVMNGGWIVEDGATATFRETATHPYAIGLLGCVPTLETVGLERLPTMGRMGV
jgi:peptide/nickel transport system ATP-binding protein